MLRASGLVVCACIKFILSLRLCPVRAALSLAFGGPASKTRNPRAIHIRSFFIGPTLVHALALARSDSSRSDTHQLRAHLCVLVRELLWLDDFICWPRASTPLYVACTNQCSLPACRSRIDAAQPSPAIAADFVSISIVAKPFRHIPDAFRETKQSTGLMRRKDPLHQLLKSRALATIASCNEKYLFSLIRIVNEEETKQKMNTN